MSLCKRLEAVIFGQEVFLSGSDHQASGKGFQDELKVCALVLHWAPHRHLSRNETAAKRMCCSGAVPHGLEKKKTPFVMRLPSSFGSRQPSCWWAPSVLRLVVPKNALGVPKPGLKSQAWGFPQPEPQESVRSHAERTPQEESSGFSSHSPLSKSRWEL